MMTKRGIAIFLVALALLIGAFIWKYPQLQSGARIANSYGLHLPPMGKSITAPAGRQVYEISQYPDAMPHIAETVIDPPAVHVGDMQHLEVLVSSPSEITRVYTISQLDTKEVRVPLFYVRDEKRNGETYKRFAGDWRVSDAHDQLYLTAFFAEDAAGHVNHVEHAWTDACNLGVSGDSTLNYSCGLSSTDGIQGGNFILTAGATLTLNADFDYTSGNSITIANGTIALGGGGSVKKATIYMKDVDGDHWPANANQYSSQASCTSSEGSGCVARSTLTTYTTDCNDSDSGKNQTCNYGPQPGDPCSAYSCIQYDFWGPAGCSQSGWGIYDEDMNCGGYEAPGPGCAGIPDDQGGYC